MPVPNYKTCSGCEYLPKWNVFNPKVREHHFNVARYWIDQGIDGYRLDVPYFIYPEFWQDFRQVVKAKNSELCLIAEEWRDPAQWLQGDTTDSTMNYTLRDLILGFTATKRFNAYDFVDGINRLQERIPYGYHHGMMNLLGSHDTERVLTEHLISLGHRNFVVISPESGDDDGYLSWHGTIRRRIDGVISALEENGIAPLVDKENVIEVPCTRTGGEEAFSQIKQNNSALDNFRKIFDLYISDSTTPVSQLSTKTGEDAVYEFALGKAVFYQNGTWAWGILKMLA